MSNPLITVIVPVYKAESCLERCVNSIRNQTYTHLEIILVDDGSPDQSGRICDAFAREDSRIRVFHKENGGQSSARNMGLDHMTGEYVTFVDSDDWIDSEMYAHLIDLIKAYETKIACCGIHVDFADGTKGFFNSQYPANQEICVFSKIDALREIMKNARITYSLCDKLFHRDIFSSIRMTVGKINEDTEILPKCIEEAGRLVYDPRPFYHYIMTPVSTTRGPFTLRRFTVADVTREKAEDYRVRYPELYPDAMAEYYTICIDKIMQSRNVASCKQKRDEIIASLRKPWVPGSFSMLSTEMKIKLAALRISPRLFDFTWRALDFARRHIKR